MGNNSGVNPIATDNENIKERIIVPHLRLVSIKTMGTNIIINFISTIEIDFAPSSNLSL